MLASGKGQHLLVHFSHLNMRHNPTYDKGNSCISNATHAGFFVKHCSRFWPQKPGFD